MNPSAKITASLGRAALNPNAEEFVPSSLKTSYTTAATRGGSFSLGSSKAENKPLTEEKGGKAVLNRTDSANSNASDDECRQYWRSQLPDDITPDFDFLAQLPDDSIVSEESVSDASFLDYKKTLNDATEVRTERKQHSKTQDMGLSIPTGSLKHDEIAWEQQAVLSGNQNKHFSLRNGLDNSPEFSVDHFFQNSGAEMDPVALLVNEFPGFAAQSLVDIYHANERDLSLTIEMLTQLELQEEEGSAHLHSQPSPLNLNLMEFPSLSRPELVNGPSQFHGDIDVQHPVTVQRGVELETLFPTRINASLNSRATDFAAAVRKNTGSHSSQWQYERNGEDFLLGSSRALSKSLGVGLSASSRGQISQSRRSHLPQVWLETGDAVANIYSELREEARDHARIRNAYFEQARQAYLIGNKALAKELSTKGQWHNSLMKAAHNKAGEAIFQKRNVSAAQLEPSSQGQPRLLDLHGLHVSEAIPLLKREVATLRMAARSTQQRQHIYICVGTGHHTKGSRTPARLPLAVERYLSEEEHVDFTEPQPGMFSVVLS